jgi:hypothetical protein
MFAFIKFFQGRKASSVENIDHDRVVELMFETLPQVKEDDRWSFAVTRYVPVILMLLMLSVGCATSRPEVVNGLTLPEQLNAYIDDYYDQTVDVCIEIHGNAQLGKSKVDCSIAGNAMLVSFPSVEFHNRDDIYRKAQELEYNWCASAQSKTGERATWVRYFRAERRKMQRPCYQGDELRALQSSLNYEKPAR